MNKTYRKTTHKGSLGEEIASLYLKKLGWKIRERNFKCKCGEIDIICTKKGMGLLFVEVKNYRKESMVHPLEMIQFTQRRKLSNAIGVYLAKYRIDNLAIRMDIILVENGLVSSHLKNICL